MRDDWSIIKPYTLTPPVDVGAIIRALGIVYLEIPMPADQSGTFRRLPDRFEIAVNAGDGPQRRRFSAAHELGHYILHRDLLGSEIHVDRLFGQSARGGAAPPFSDVHDAQASRYAVDILLPSAAVLQAFAAARNDIGVVARLFGVSLKAMTVRLESLGAFPALAV